MESKLTGLFRSVRRYLGGPRVRTFDKWVHIGERSYLSDTSWLPNTYVPRPANRFCYCRLRKSYPITNLAVLSGRSIEDISFHSQTFFEQVVCAKINRCVIRRVFFRNYAKLIANKTSESLWHGSTNSAFIERLRNDAVQRWTRTKNSGELKNMPPLCKN